ncbi:hypothetical protein BT63DRAFT_260871 [Microthyrium microscopicum]|uniref:Uncharacterized protein n=1 Tax=Microthyrium microscopicum TaxID=703497 RepID=A0A6A6UAY6_9PEZI|nr:hypothetical protein BT63DRAFT_260871 [Microthyrium microscopicum]
MYLNSQWNANFAQLLSYGPFSTAVLRRDINEVSQHLERDSAVALLEQSGLNQTPLHLASDWPDGLALILTYVDEYEAINATDANNESALNYTINQNSTHCFRLLMSTGLVRQYFDHRLIGYGIKPLIPEIYLCIAEVMSSSCEQLIHEAQRLISCKEWDRYALLRDRTFDSSVIDLLDQLHFDDKEKVNRISLLIPQRGNIFHNIPFWGSVQSTNLILALLSSGFGEIDTTWNGVSPVMCWRSKFFAHEDEFCAILMNKELDLYRRIPEDLIKPSDISNDSTAGQCLAIHKVASTHGWCLPEKSSLNLENPSEVAKESSSKYWEIIFTDQSADTSSCGCSMLGHTALTLFLKHLDFLPFLRCIKSGLNNPAVMLHIGSILERTARIFIFQELGLTHTCLSYYSWWNIDSWPDPMVTGPSADEIRDIQWEEEEGLARLEKTLRAVMIKISENQAPWPYFIEHDFLNHILVAIEDTEAPVGEQDIYQIKAAGVVIEEDDEVYSHLNQGDDEERFAVSDDEDHLANGEPEELRYTYSWQKKQEVLFTAS